MDFSALRRDPDITGPGLAAFDAADRLILDEAAPLPGRAVAVIDDGFGALSIGAARAGAATVRSHQDLITGERALAANAARADVTVGQVPFGPEAVAGAEVVLLRLPRSLDRLAETAALIAAHAEPAVRVVAGGRIKHMSTSMNDVLRSVFERVDVTHARQKSRVLIASGPRPEAARTVLATWPRTATVTYDDARPPLTVAAHGGVFAGAALDIGTRFLLSRLDGLPAAATAVDLACGTGVIAVALARRDPGLQVIATDRSAAAVASARATAAANGVADRITVARADGLETLAGATQELVLLNPPFHSEAALTTGIAGHLFAEAARVLRPGGELWCVWNSHLRYRPLLERVVGPTRQIARNAKFTVTASRRADPR